MRLRRPDFWSVGLRHSLLGLLFPLTVVQAQGVTGVLEGRVTDIAGAPLSSVDVAASGPNLPGSRVVQSGVLGQFRLLALPAGPYVLRFRLVGYRPVRTDTVEVRLARTTVLPGIRLELQPVLLKELVVRSEGATIDPYTAALGWTLVADEFENLPLERSYADMVTLLPFASGSVYGEGPNIAGSTGLENAYYIDGLNVTDPYRGLGGTTLPYNFIDQVELKAGGYEAEYGRATGGIVNVVTRSGGNELHGSAFGFFTGNSLSADTRLGRVELGRGTFRRYDLGLAIGGPIVRDRAWFFAAYNPSFERQDLILPGAGSRPDRNVTHQLAAKATWHPTAGPTITATIVGDPSIWDRVGHNSPFSPSPPLSAANPDLFLGRWKEGGIHGAARAQWPISQRFLVEAEAARSDVRLIANAATERGRTDPLFVDLTTGVWSGGYGNTFDHHTTRSSAALAGTAFLGSHILKVGLQHESNFLDEAWRWLSGGPDSAGLIVRFDTAGPGSVWTFPLDFRTGIRNRVTSLFVQGSIALLPRLRLNPGIRWQGEYQKGLNSGLNVALPNEWQPRVGVTYLLGQDNRRKLSSSYGRFYEQMPLLPLSFYVGPLLQDFIFYDHDPRTDPTGGTRLSTIVVSLPDFRGEHLDEFALGYEHQLAGGLKLEVRGIHRRQREVVQDAIDPADDTRFLMGNPGSGGLAFLPRPVRQYTAGTITLQHHGSRLDSFVSYTASRSYGNYTGLFSSDLGLSVAVPNTGLMYDDSAQVVNAKGLLPNDRTHVFKLFGSYRFSGGVHLATSFLAQSGTPLNELGGNAVNAPSFTFLQPRGTVGRTSAIWDWSVRVSYDVGRALGTSFKAKAILDLFHVFSPRRPVLLDQQHFFAADSTGAQLSENPNYLQPLLYQPPMTARLGAVVDF